VATGRNAGYEMAKAWRKRMTAKAEKIFINGGAKMVWLASKAAQARR